MRVPKEPGPDHPISVAPAKGRVIVKAGGKILADSSRALTMREADYPVVQYVPRSDVDMSVLVRTDHATY